MMFFFKFNFVCEVLLYCKEVVLNYLKRKHINYVELFFLICHLIINEQTFQAYTLLRWRSINFYHTFPYFCSITYHSMQYFFVCLMSLVNWQLWDTSYFLVHYMFKLNEHWETNGHFLFYLTSVNDCGNVCRKKNGLYLNIFFKYSSKKMVIV